jgi:Fic family protein
VSHKRPANFEAGESSQRIEPTVLDNPDAAIRDLLVEIARSSKELGTRLHPMTGASLAALVRIMNAYYSNLIEGHNTLPRDIARALVGELSDIPERRVLQLEAASHVRVQAQIDQMAAEGTLPEPASSKFIAWIHRSFYENAPEELLHVRENDPSYRMQPGIFRRERKDDVIVGRHEPPTSATVEQFMRYFEERYSFEQMGPSDRILSIAAAHHRFNYIHPFPDGNGRVSRLMSHAMAHAADIASHGLWSISRGLARGLSSRTEYKAKLDEADTPRRGDLDGRGNLSRDALEQFTVWFLRVELDQIAFMASLFDLQNLSERLRHFVDRHEQLKPESYLLLDAALTRGEFARGMAPSIAGLPERSARRILDELLNEGLLASATPKGPVSLRFPQPHAEWLFPRLFDPTMT